MIRIAKWIGAFMVLAGFVSVAQAVLPSANLISAPTVTPAAAATFYGSNTTHTDSWGAWLAPGPPEIVALARTLGSEHVLAGRITPVQYAQNVFDYVRNNIDLELRFGLGKGARGALIDQSGTPFDQAELMVKLLRKGGVAADFKYGSVTMSAAQFGKWTGLVTALNVSNQTFTVNARSSCQLLADGGIPADFPSGCASVSGNLSNIAFQHIWVLSAGSLFDPSFKQHILANGIDVAAAMTCGANCGTDMIAAAGGTIGTSSGYRSLTGVSESGLHNWLRGRATNLKNSLLTNNRLSRSQDVVGGKRLANTTVIAGASLPYTASASPVTWSLIPDQFRTRLRVGFISEAPTNTNWQGGVQTFYADDIAGRLLQLASDNRFLLDGTNVAAASTCGTCTVGSTIYLDVFHPYAASSGNYADEHMEMLMWADPGIGSSLPSRGAFPVTIVHGWGNASPATERHFQNLRETLMGGWTDAWEVGVPITRTELSYENSDQPLVASKLLSQGASFDRLLTGMARSHCDSSPSRRRHRLRSPIQSRFLARYPVQSAVSVAEHNTPIRIRGKHRRRSATFDVAAAGWAMLEGSVNQHSRTRIAAFRRRRRSGLQ